jgi:L-lactate dehydrogenase complex protein LldE
LGLIADLQLMEISSAYSCCGFGGLFSLKRSDLSQAIGSNYLKAMLSTGAATLISPDVGCLLHLQGMLRQTNLHVPMYHIAELIQQAAYNR